MENWHRIVFLPLLPPQMCLPAGPQRRPGAGTCLQPRPPLPHQHLPAQHQADPEPGQSWPGLGWATQRCAPCPAPGQEPRGPAGPCPPCSSAQVPQEVRGCSGGAGGTCRARGPLAAGRCHASLRAAPWWGGLRPLLSCGSACVQPGRLLVPLGTRHVEREAAQSWWPGTSVSHPCPAGSDPFLRGKGRGLGVQSRGHHFGGLTLQAWGAAGTHGARGALPAPCPCPPRGCAGRRALRLALLLRWLLSFAAAND